MRKPLLLFLFLAMLVALWALRVKHPVYAPFEGELHASGASMMYEGAKRGEVYLWAKNSRYYYEKSVPAYYLIGSKDAEGCFFVYLYRNAINEVAHNYDITPIKKGALMGYVKTLGDKTPFITKKCNIGKEEEVFTTEHPIYAPADGFLEVSESSSLYEGQNRGVAFRSRDSVRLYNTGLPSLYLYTLYDKESGCTYVYSYQNAQKSYIGEDVTQGELIGYAKTSEAAEPFITANCK